VSYYLSSLLHRLRRDESGQGATEYAIITVLVVAAIAAITLGLTGALNTAYQVVSNAITDAVS
jgi:Flp pilus assembly pilin Flp